MLTGLHIKDYAIVESLDLDIQAGMTVITARSPAVPFPAIHVGGRLRPLQGRTLVIPDHPEQGCR